MKEIIRKEDTEIEIIKIKENVSVLDYLKKDSSKFVLRAISSASFEELKEMQPPIDFGSYLCWNTVADYGQVKDADELLRLGHESFQGYFTVDNSSIVYNPFKPKRYAYIYSGVEYFTKLDVPHLLFEVLKKKGRRDLLVNMSDTRIGESTIYNQIDEIQMLEYALHPEKGKQLLKTIRNQKQV